MCGLEPVRKSYLENRKNYLSGRSRFFGCLSIKYVGSTTNNTEVGDSRSQGIIFLFYVSWGGALILLYGVTKDMFEGVISNAGKYGKGVRKKLCRSYVYLRRMFPVVCLLCLFFVYKVSYDLARVDLDRTPKSRLDGYIDMEGVCCFSLG